MRLHNAGQHCRATYPRQAQLAPRKAAALTQASGAHLLTQHITWLWLPGRDHHGPAPSMSRRDAPQLQQAHLFQHSSTAPHRPTRASHRPTAGRHAYSLHAPGRSDSAVSHLVATLEWTALNSASSSQWQSSSRVTTASRPSPIRARERTIEA